MNSTNKRRTSRTGRYSKKNRYQIIGNDAKKKSENDNQQTYENRLQEQKYKIIEILHEILSNVSDMREHEQEVQRNAVNKRKDAVLAAKFLQKDLDKYVKKKKMKESGNNNTKINLTNDVYDKIDVIDKKAFEELRILKDESVSDKIMYADMLDLYNDNYPTMHDEMIAFNKASNSFNYEFSKNSKGISNYDKLHKYVSYARDRNLQSGGIKKKKITKKKKKITKKKKKTTKKKKKSTKKKK
jgi:hypothetical protein